jgi:hypothetical protein
MVSPLADRSDYWAAYYSRNRVKTKAKVMAWRKRNQERQVAYDRIRWLRSKAALCSHDKRELRVLEATWKITPRRAA